jgi:hypothetical protein
MAQAGAWPDLPEVLLFQLIRKTIVCSRHHQRALDKPVSRLITGLSHSLCALLLLRSLSLEVPRH